MIGRRDHKLVGSNASCVELTTGNGRGAVNTVIRRYSVTKQNYGPAMTYADDANSGMSVTINISGNYFISYTDTYTGVVNFGISVNSNQLTTAFTSITPINRIATMANSANVFAYWSTILKLNKTDVVRAHQIATGTPSTSINVNFYMLFISE